MKFFRNFLTAAVLTLASTAVLAEKPETRTFERDGVTYKYTATEVDGVTILRGRAKGGASFRLVVTKTRVRGTVGSKYVTFVRPNSQADDNMQIAAN